MPKISHRTFVIGLCCVLNLLASAYAHITLIELEELYHMEEDLLIDYRGQIHRKIAFTDQLHEDLAYVLKDPEQAKIIHTAYLDHILPLIPQEFRESFSNALLKVCVIFGSNRFSPESALLSTLKEENPDASNWASQHLSILKEFIAQANRSARPNPVPNQETADYTIVILTTTASGGNHSVASAIERYLSDEKGIHCILVDVEAVAKDTDLIMLATGAITYDGIYEKHFQQNNQGLETLIRRDVISKQLGKYIPSCLGQQLKELMRSINPDLILSTRSYTIDDIPLCTLGIPFRLIHCDYELSFFLMHLYGKIHPEIMKFWLPSFEPQVFRPLFTKTNKLELYHEHDEPEALINKIAAITQQPIEMIQGQFELLGYPLKQEFYSIDDCKLLEKLHKKWGIKAEEIPVLISMGKNGVGVIEEIFEELHTFTDYPPKFPIKYIFVCGKNDDLRGRLEQKAHMQTNFFNNAISFKICGLLTAQEMNELMNLCPLYITKPGGAVTSEALETGIHLLTMCSHPWEEANGSKIESLGIGRKVQNNIPLSLQVEDYLEKIGHIKRAVHPSIPWKDLLMKHIHGIWQDHSSISNRSLTEKVLITR